MLKEGDKLTLSAGFPLKLDEFQYLKPHAAITRTMSDDVTGDIQDMEDALGVALRRSLVCCIMEISDLVEKLDAVDGDVDALAELVTKELSDGKVSEVPHIKVESNVSRNKKAVKKGSVSKPARKKGAKKKKLAG